VARATAKTAAMGLSGQVDFTKGDFMRPPFADGTFDAAYAIEATCHAPDRTGCFSEIHRMLKPGGVFGGCVPPRRPASAPSTPLHPTLTTVPVARAGTSG
jgi:sterol 24-C-methyltransferase